MFMTGSTAACLRANTHLPAVTLALAAFLTQFDVTAVVIAMPSIGRDLDLDIAGFAWVMDAYSLAFTAALLAAGALSDRFGRRRAMIAGNMLFLTASLACSVAWDGPTLWAARAAQGVGAAFTVTGAYALLANIYVMPKDRARAFGLTGVVSGVAMALGPTLGGIIATSFGWRWIFIANLPLCSLIAWAVPRLAAESRADQSKPIDVEGIALLTTALGLTVASLLKAHDAPAYAALGIVIAVVLLFFFAVGQRRRTTPMFDLVIFAQREMRGIISLLLAVSVGYWAILVYLPLFFALGFGWSPQYDGLALLAATLPMLVLPVVGSRLAIRWGWRRLFATGLAITAFGNGLLAGLYLVADGPLRLVALMVGMACIGTGAALAHPQLSGAVVALIPPEQAGMASAITVTARQGGFAIGIAALGTALPHDASPWNFACLFLLAATASAAGCGAALRLLPPGTQKATTGK